MQLNHKSFPLVFLKITKIFSFFLKLYRNTDFFFFLLFVFDLPLKSVFG